MIIAPKNPGAPLLLDALLAVSDLAGAVGGIEGAIAGIIMTRDLEPHVRACACSAERRFKQHQKTLWAAVAVAMRHSEEFREELGKEASP